MNSKKKNIKYLLLILSTYLCISCSLFKSEELEYENVMIPNKEKVEIKDQDYDYGPSLTKKSDISQSTEEKVLGLVFSPAFYDSFIYLGILKALDEKKIKYSVIGTSGFTSIIITSYAFAQSKKQSFEWLSYKLKKSLGANKPYEQSWINALDEYIENQFIEVKRSDVNKVLVYKLDELDSNKSVYDSVSPFHLVLRQGIRDSNEDYKNKMVNFSREVFNIKNLLKYGVDKLLWIDINNKNLSLESEKSSLAQMYRLVRSNIVDEKNLADFNMDFESSFKVSKVGNVGRKIKFGYNKAKNWIEENKESLK